MSQKSLEPSIQTHRELQADAYITVYLSLSLMIILSLILALLQGARAGAVKMKSELVTDIAMNSVLGEYNRELFDRYGLLFIDTTYGSGSGSVINTREHIKEYFSKNFEKSPVGLLTGRTTMIPATLSSVDITGFSVATDGNGAVLRRQILSYMGSDPVEAAIRGIQDNAQTLRQSGFADMNVERDARSCERDLNEPRDLDLDGNGENETYFADNPAAGVTAQKSIGILTLAAPDINELSSAAIDSSKCASHRQLGRGTGLDESESTGVGPDMLLEKYIHEKCGCYGNEIEDSHLKYELEYIYAGKDSDYENLKKVVEKLFVIKEAANFVHIINDPVKLEEAEALALTASILLVIPELEQAIKMAIIFAWTFAETISDLRILLSGGKVPLIKNTASWNLSLENMLDFRDHLQEGGGSGLSYEDYLKMLLIMENKQKKTRRLMDIIEINIRKVTGNTEFKLDGCIDTLSADFDIIGAYGKRIQIERTYGYEMFD
ncbi:DUF5702 domain-containing protein [Butyrivibrio sp. VCD2006]|uniref:DUF5702 domain-containing protein n=1 Tax=Butyrivibrio sp. VCD2006 TaxID=1280664 RepID=UPI0012DF1A9B|nr:DUF5702 domain-containing protein [Butyrivibrio sp. VCD2006]